MGGIVFKDGRLWVVDAQAYEEKVGFSEEEQRVIVEGKAATDSMVPPLPGPYKAFVVFSHEKPIGLIGVKEVSESTVEVAVRFWDRGAYNARLVGRLLSVVFVRYENVLAVVYHKNAMIKRLLQRAAFVLLGRERRDGRTLETYGCRREDFERVLGDDL